MIAPLDVIAFNVDPGIGTGDQAPDTTFGKSLQCVGTWTKLVCVIKKIADWIKTITKITKALDYLPHSFPFGGHIEKSERACGFHFRVVTWIKAPTVGILFLNPACTPTTPCFPLPIPKSFTIGLVGRAIVVGPPVPTYSYGGSCNKYTNVCSNGIGPCTEDKHCGSNDDGWVIAFPWISNIYRNHNEAYVGPWALGLGFSPFPLPEINAALEDIRIWVPPTLLDRDCMAPDPTWAFKITDGFIGQPIAVCVDRFSFDCKSSGGKDEFGVEIYKVIRKLGTGPR